MGYYQIVTWKAKLLKNLDRGVCDEHEWLNFIKAAANSGCGSIADDMLRRLNHYRAVAA